MDRERIKSESMSHILDTHSLNKHVSKLKQRDQRLEEFTETFLCGTFSMASGGCAEGTEIHGSDSDVMNILKGVVVVQRHEHVPNTAVELEIRTDGCNPSYVKLVRKRMNYFAENVPTDRCSVQFLSNLSLIETKCGNDVYISSKQFNGFISFSQYLFPDKFTGTAVIMSGPAHKNKTLFGEIDYVAALECYSWPTSARKWLNRSRKYQWPHKEFLKSLPDKCKCYVVPTGDESSSIADIQWRISFVSIERELVWLMTDTQLKCFITLKILLKHIKDALPNDTLKTYHLKNAMFWLLEETAKEQWKAHLLHSRVVDCLKKILHYVTFRNLPQYILPENNLFRNRFLTDADVKETTACLEKLSENIFQIVKTEYNFVGRVIPKEVIWYIDETRCNNDLGNFIIWTSSGKCPASIIDFKDRFSHKSNHFFTV